MNSFLLLGCTGVLLNNAALGIYVAIEKNPSWKEVAVITAWTWWVITTMMAISGLIEVML